LSDQASQGGQVEPGVGLKGERLVPEVAVDGQSFEIPAFEGGVASFGSVAGAVVEAFPGWGVHGDVSHQADGVILEALSHVDELTVGMVEVGALIRRIGSPFDGSNGSGLTAAGVEAGPFVALAVEVEAVGLEGIAEGADGTALVVVAAQRPEGFVLVGLVSAQVDDPSGVEFGVDSVEEDVVAQGRISGDGIYFQVGIEDGELEQESGGGILLPVAGRQEVVE